MKTIIPLFLALLATVSLYAQHEELVSKTRFDSTLNVINQLKAENNDLSNYVNTATAILPTTVNFNDINITYQTVTLLFETNRPGKVRLTLNNGSHSSMLIDPMIQKNHNFTFRNLIPNTTYNGVLEILDFNNTPYRRFTHQDLQGLSIRLPERSLAPTIDNIKLDSSGNSEHAIISVSYNFRQPSLLQINCSEEIQGTTEYKLSQTYDSRTLISSANKMNGQSFQNGVYHFKNLNFGKKYKIEVIAYALNGEATVASARTITTPFKAEEIAFDSPVRIKFSPYDLKVNWQSNVKPDLSFFTIFDASNPGKRVQIDSSGYDNTTKQVTLYLKKYKDIYSALSFNDPIIIVGMNKNGKVVDQKFSVTFTIPSSTDLKNNRAALGADADNIISTVEKIEQNRKINWANVAKTGIPIVAKLLAVAATF